MKPAAQRASRLARIAFFLGCAGAIFADDVWVGGFDFDFHRIPIWNSSAPRGAPQIAPPPEQTPEVAARAEQAEREMGQLIDSLLFSKPLPTWTFMNFQSKAGPTVEINGARATASATEPAHVNEPMPSIPDSFSSGSTNALVASRSSVKSGSISPTSASGGGVDFNWNQTGGGSWSTSTNWTPNSPAGGPDAPDVYAKINTNITSDSTINLFNTGESGDAVKTIGRLEIGDTNGDAKFTIAPGTGGGSLAFDNPVNSQPAIQQLSTSAGDTISANIDIAQFQLLVIDNASANALNLSGTISGDHAGIYKTGTGRVNLTGANTFTGGTTIDEGTLAVSGGTLLTTSYISVDAGGTLLLQGTGDRIGDSVPMEMGGGTFNTDGNSETLGKLTLFAPSIIDMASGASILKFADSRFDGESPWNTLHVYNWSGNPISGNGTDQLFFGTNTSGLDQFQLDSIRFYSDAGTTFLGTAVWATDGDGEVVPIPEPATWIGGAVAVLALVATAARRRRVRAV